MEKVIRTKSPNPFVYSRFETSSVNFGLGEYELKVTIEDSESLKAVKDFTLIVKDGSNSDEN